MRSAQFPLLTCLALLLTASVTSQVASYERIAAGCVGSQGVPKLSAVADSLPILGQGFSAELSNVPMNGMAVGINGLSTANWGAFSLPFDLTSVGMPNCFLHTDIRWTTGLVIAGGRTSWDVTIPSAVEWIGRSFFQQVVVLESGGGVVMSDAVEAVIGWTPPDVFLESTIPGQTFATRPGIASSGDSVYVAWEDGRSGIGRDIFFTRSLDAGATWLKPNIRLNTDGHAATSSEPPQIVTSGDSVYVTWKDQRDGQLGDIYFNRSLDSGSTWLTSDIRLNTNHPGTAASLRPEIAASGNSVYVTWMDGRNDRSIFGNHWDIHFNRSLDGGATWLTSDLRLNHDLPGAAGSQLPQIRVSDDSIYVTWTDERNGEPDIYFNRSIDRGTNWLTSDIRLNTNLPGADTSFISKIASSNDSLYVTWWDRRDGEFDIYFNRSLDGGISWLASDIRLDTDLPGANCSEWPQIAASGNSVYVTWLDRRDSALNWSTYFNRSLDGGATWLTSDIRLDTNMPFPLGLNQPQVAVSGESVFVTWSTGRHICLNHSLDHGTTWLTSSIRLDTDLPGMTESESPQIAASGDFVYVTWGDRRDQFFPGWYDIYFNRVSIR